MKISNFLNEIFFKTFKKREKKKKVVKLISPNSGEIVTLKILEHQLLPLLVKPYQYLVN